MQAPLNVAPAVRRLPEMAARSVLVDRGIIRTLDLAFQAKDGSVAAIDWGELAQASPAVADLEGASPGLLGQDDLEGAASTFLCPGPFPRGPDLPLRPVLR